MSMDKYRFDRQLNDLLGEVRRLDGDALLGPQKCLDIWRKTLKKKEDPFSVLPFLYKVPVDHKGFNACDNDDLWAILATPKRLILCSAKDVPDTIPLNWVECIRLYRPPWWQRWISGTRIEFVFTFESRLANLVFITSHANSAEKFECSCMRYKGS